jgi:hypothetical protein
LPRTPATAGSRAAESAGTSAPAPPGSAPRPAGSAHAGSARARAARTRAAHGRAAHAARGASCRPLCPRTPPVGTRSTLAGAARSALGAGASVSPLGSPGVARGSARGFRAGPTARVTGRAAGFVPLVSGATRRAAAGARPAAPVPELPPSVTESPLGSKKSMSSELEQATTRAIAPKSGTLF